MPHAEDSERLDLLAQAFCFQSGQNLVAEVRQFVDVVHKRDRRAGKSGLADRLQSIGDLVGVSDQRIDAMSGGEAVAEELERLRRCNAAREVCISDFKLRAYLACAQPLPRAPNFS